MPINDIQKGNLVSYFGKLGHQPVVEIENLETGGEETMYWMKKRFSWDKEFVAYDSEINSIPLAESHLQRLGFVTTAKGRYEFNGLAILKCEYPEGNDPINLTWIDLGFRIYPDPDIRFKTIDELEKNTIAIPYLHSLQNYLTEYNQGQLEFDKIRS